MFLAPFLEELFCERGISSASPIHSRSAENSLASMRIRGTNEDDPNCDYPKYSTAIAKSIGMVSTLAAVLSTKDFESHTQRSQPMGWFLPFSSNWRVILLFRLF
jgi:hypothetical protein